MTQGELEKLALKTGNIFSELEIRIMTDIVRRIRINGFSTATADAQMATLRRLGRSETSIKEWVAAALQRSDEELDRIFSDDIYREYYKHQRAYQVNGFEQIPLEQNRSLQQLIESVKIQINNEYENITGSMGFALRAPDGRITYSPLMEYYRSTLDNAAVDIQTGGFDYASVLQRTITQMTNSGIRWVNYDSGVHNRVDVAARRAVMTGFRQVQAHINEQVAVDLGTDSYEVSYHMGARPSHQPWQGRVWTKDQLIRICGLGSVTGLCGANCYHDYNAFIPGVSVRTYTDEQLEQMLAEENTQKEYYGKSFTTYEALQEQRRMERNMRATRQQIKLLQEGEADEKTIILKKARYQGQCQVYKDFSDKMGLPQQKQRILQDGLRGRFTPTKVEITKVNQIHQGIIDLQVKRARKSKFSERFTDINNGQKDIITTRKLMNNLNKTEIGQEIVSYIVEHPELHIHMCYNIDHDPEIRGYQDKDDIYIYASDTKTVQITAETIIHEVTHHRYDIGDSRWAECVCFAQERKHRTNKSKLTGDELRIIIKTVNELYSKLPWR